MRKKEKICPYCNKAIRQGHDIKKCKERKWKTYKVSNRKMYVPIPYEKGTYEIIPLSENTFAATLSGAQRLGNAISGEVYAKERDAILSIKKEFNAQVTKNESKKKA